jgi:hypothetical protein
MRCEAIALFKGRRLQLHGDVLFMFAMITTSLVAVRANAVVGRW